MPRPIWLEGHGGDTREARAQNLKKIAQYIGKLVRDGIGLPADPSRPGEIYWKQISEESGISRGLLARPTNQCRQIILGTRAIGLEVKVRVKPRVRETYTLEEMISITRAVVQDDCQSRREDYRPKCKKASNLIRAIAKRGKNGLHDDSIKSISVALEQQHYSDEDAKLLVEIRDIALRATRGELELHTFHGRLRLESALIGFSLSVVARFTKANYQTVVHWAEGVKAPTLSFKSEISKIEKGLRLREGYLADVYFSNRSGPSNVKQRYLPQEIRSLPRAGQQRFRSLFEEDIDLGQLDDDELNRLMDEKLAIFRAEIKRNADTVSYRRSKLRLGDMRYALKELPRNAQKEFDQLVVNRTSVTGLDGTIAQKRGWDPNTVKIYHYRFRLFFGWLHNVLGVPLSNLSIAYLGFPQVLRDYDVFLVTRKVGVGMEAKRASSALQFYIFASSLTRRELGVVSEMDDCEGDVGWLRNHSKLIKTLLPIDRPRLVDQIAVKERKRYDIRPILTAADISKASRNWEKQLDEATKQYRYLRAAIKDDIASPDHSHMSNIFLSENPLRVIEKGAWKYSEAVSRMKCGSSRWCTGIRNLVMVKFLVQVPLREETFCLLTYRSDNSGMVFRRDQKWWLKIPAKQFKNEKSEAFQRLTLDGFYVVTLEDEWGLYNDLDMYVREARDKVLEGVRSDAFFVTRRNEGHVGSKVFANQFRAFTNNYVAENPGRRTGEQGVKPFGPHAVRPIVASAIFNRTNSLAAAAAAIHDSERITEKHYKRFFVDPKKRANIMRTVLGREPDSPAWPTSDGVLPRTASPPTAPEMPPVDRKNRRVKPK